MWRTTGSQNKDEQNTRMTEQKWTKQQEKEHRWREQQKDIRRMDIHKTGG
jgi:hypothetical protein